MKTRILAWTCLAATIGLAITSSGLAADNLKLLVQVSQAKADAANDDADDPPPPKSLTVGEGAFISDLSGQAGAIRLGFDRQQLPYIEQGNLRGTILDAAVDRDGTITFTAYDDVADLFLRIEAAPVSWHRTGEIDTLAGSYEILRPGARGSLRPVDRGTLGIIAILIGL